MTLREQIVKGLGKSWTKELEESLYWSMEEFLNAIRPNIRKNAFDEFKDHLDQLKTFIINIENDFPKEE